MKTKGVIFDLDGVIVSTDNMHYIAWKKIADDENIYFDRTINNKLRGVSRMESLDIILEKSAKTYDENEKKSLCEKKNSIYVELLSELNETYILPGVLNVLTKLKENKIKLAIGSSSKNSKYILEKIKVLDYFDEIADGNNIKNSKPHPEVFLLAAQKLKLDPKDCIVIEDATSGIDAANSAGMTSVAVNEAQNYSKADYSLNSIEDILTINL